MASSKASPEDFVLVWNNSNSPEEVAEKIGCSANAARTRARKYRKKGIKLNYHYNLLRQIERIEEVRALAKETADTWDFDEAVEKYGIGRK